MQIGRDYIQIHGHMPPLGCYMHPPDNDTHCILNLLIRHMWVDGFLRFQSRLVMLLFLSFLSPLGYKKQKTAIENQRRLELTNNQVNCVHYSVYSAHSNRWLEFLRLSMTHLMGLYAQHRFPNAYILYNIKK